MSKKETTKELSLLKLNNSDLNYVSGGLRRRGGAGKVCSCCCMGDNASGVAYDQKRQSSKK